jgi:hypothetical protein
MTGWRGRLGDARVFSHKRIGMRGTASVKTAGSLDRAIDFLRAGAWQEAHEIVQAEDSELAAWLHGIVHTLEGDLDNARYWYRKAGRVFPGPGAVQEELAAARRAVQAKMAG